MSLPILMHKMYSLRIRLKRMPFINQLDPMKILK